jgi:predicted glycosyltransferase involved in capsule biosynthesis
MLGVFITGKQIGIRESISNMDWNIRRSEEERNERRSYAKIKKEEELRKKEALTSLSFCITCMGRLSHLKRTLRRNLEVTSHLNGIEFILVNYSSPDQLDKWIAQEFREYIESGRLVYFKIDDLTEFNRSHAKNIAHLCARGQIVCNLDADNFLGKGFAEFIFSKLSSDRHAFIAAPPRPGVRGRLVFLKKHFLALGGYNEEMKYGWGTEDLDLMLRASKVGLKKIPIPPRRGFLKAIEHSDRLRVLRDPLKDIRKSRIRHRKIRFKRLRQGRFVANSENVWGRGLLIKNFKDIIKSGHIGKSKWFSKNLER